ncbi:unnamed protein product [Clonostachys rosea]|uniref:Oxidoreductase n=1 Tax=Bionectria ochroleuca TaxID=29856 RepID=A0ABY6V0L6_BIOOC|nr:unnamed protein product [Clonostachys rosea]
MPKARSALEELVENPRQKLDILTCNAGVMNPPEGKTKDGFETQVGTNHLAHYLLFNLLSDALVAAATPEFPSRVVILASVAHHFGGVDFNDYNFEGNYDKNLAYATSETANEIKRRFEDRHVHAWSVQPSAVITNLTRSQAVPPITSRVKELSLFDES